MLSKAAVSDISKHKTRTCVSASLDLDGDQTRQVMQPVLIYRGYYGEPFSLTRRVCCAPMYIFVESVVEPSPSTLTLVLDRKPVIGIYNSIQDLYC